MMYKEIIAWEGSDGKLYANKAEAIAASFQNHIINIRAYLTSIETVQDKAGSLEMIQDESQCALEDLEMLETLRNEK